MYVNQLQKGMLLTASAGNKLILQNDMSMAQEEMVPDITVCSSVIDREDEGYEGVLTGPVIYLGWEQEHFIWDGVYKHHRVLAGGTIALVSGYNFKNFKPLLKC
ncbi:hypothetical protein CL634_10290 [bacterium]|nr:hypothetical protein [bacterium]